METLQDFMLLFRFEPSTEMPTTEQLQEMEKQWGQFIGNIAMQGKLVNTYQLGFEGKKIAANQYTEEGFYVAENLMLSGTMVLKANSIEAATELAKNCPILFMGGTVEVRSIIPMN
ncbi:YciI family protein [Flavobacterium sp.]|uniref:YciI family protein n=1 Tax=Flavobacterium sp. TaxID=239 RepID=UPI0037533EFB